MNVHTYHKAETRKQGLFGCTKYICICSCSTYFKKETFLDRGYFRTAVLVEVVLSLRGDPPRF